MPSKLYFILASKIFCSYFLCSFAHGQSYCFYQWSNTLDCEQHQVLCTDRNQFDSLNVKQVSDHNCQNLVGPNVRPDEHTRRHLHERNLLASQEIVDKQTLESNLCSNFQLVSRFDLEPSRLVTEKKNRTKIKSSSSWNVFGLVFDIIEAILEVVLTGD